MENNQLNSLHKRQGKDRDLAEALKNIDWKKQFEKNGIGNISSSEILEDNRKLLQQGKDQGQKFGLIRIRSANEVMEQAAKQPIPKMLFDEFWFEGELCVLFADTGITFFESIF